MLDAALYYICTRYNDTWLYSLETPHTARSWGWYLGCLLRVYNLTKILHLSLFSCIHYHVRTKYVLSRVYCSKTCTNIVNRKYAKLRYFLWTYLNTLRPGKMADILLSWKYLNFLIRISLSNWQYVNIDPGNGLALNRRHGNLKQFWQRSMVSDGVTRPKWVNHIKENYFLFHPTVKRVITDALKWLKQYSVFLLVIGDTFRDHN